MSAFDEYAAERRRIEALLREGYCITGIREDLDGARVSFATGGARVEKRAAELLLLTADARKLVTTLAREGLKPAAG